MIGYRFKGEYPANAQEQWLSEQLAKHNLALVIANKGKKNPENPCLQVFGPGPEGAKCKTCVHLRYHETARRYYKCDQRAITRGAATDHKVNWPACGKFTPLGV
jgi:hypothetical protein